ncbi:hypothetical protein K502DRAFT_239106 [Neoconidiobolus thromboides FSU 785]|nr:hypothetical protein K502DRAFT_239106 [Neoconidiobolus thromboides FSU 785]
MKKTSSHSSRQPIGGVPILPIPGMPKIPQISPKIFDNISKEESSEVINEDAAEDKLENLEEKNDKICLAEIITDYTAQTQGELTLIAGDVLSVLEQGEEYWKGDYHGKIGYFPPSAVKLTNETSPGLKEEDPSPGKGFKLAAYGVKKGGLGGLFATGGLPQLRRSNTGHSPKPSTSSPIETHLTKEVKREDSYDKKIKVYLQM